jgi:hypothetical protein
MLGMLSTVRGWLAEKREQVSRGRVFTYRRILTPKELEQRTRALTDARLRRDALVWLDGIGGIFPPAALCPRRTMALPYRPSIELGWRDREIADMAVEIIYFAKFEVCNSYHPDFRAYALLIDECDSTGLRMLCKELDRKTSRQRYLRDERLWT